MAKKPVQFQIPEKLREEMETCVRDAEITLSEFIRQSVRLHVVIKNYTDQGYELVLRKKGERGEKEIILP